MPVLSHLGVSCADSRGVVLPGWDRDGSEATEPLRWQIRHVSVSGLAVNQLLLIGH